MHADIVLKVGFDLNAHELTPELTYASGYDIGCVSQKRFKKFMDVKGRLDQGAELLK